MPLHYLCRAIRTFLSVKTSVLLSKQWCDLVFEGRNKCYGAYYIRSRAGVRYRRALLSVFGTLFVLFTAFFGTALYAQYVLKRELAKAEDLFARKPSDLKEGYDVKFLQTARLVPPKRMKPGAKSEVPKIVDGTPPLETIGTDGPIDFDPLEQIITTPIVDTTNLSTEDLPVAKQKVVPTERVSRMPEFPGGLRAFMKWMDEAVVYPRNLIREKKGGIVNVSFIVDEEGYATDFDIKNAFDTQVLRIVKNALKRMPKWEPGTDEAGNAVKVMISLPIEFKAE